MQVVLHTNYGDITLAMHTETAPKTVENFLQYTRRFLRKHAISPCYR